MKAKHDYSLMSLRPKDAVVIHLVYGAILVGGLIILIFELVNNGQVPTGSIANSLATLIASSAVGSTIYYSRKLYKAGINNSYNFSTEGSESASRNATIAFFLLRPLFGVAFALLAYSLWRASVMAAVKEGQAPSDTIFLMLPIGFFSGFSAGKLVEQFEDRGVESLVKPGEE